MLNEFNSIYLDNKFENIIDNHSAQLNKFIDEYGTFIKSWEHENLGFICYMRKKGKKYYALEYKDKKLNEVHIRINPNKLIRKINFKITFLKRHTSNYRKS